VSVFLSSCHQLYPQQLVAKIKYLAATQTDGRNASIKENTFYGTTTTIKGRLFLSHPMLKPFSGEKIQSPSPVEM